jgi:hypothetical protein
MRSAILKSFVLLFAMGSVACACPGVSVGEPDRASSAHAGHAMQQGAQHESQDSHDAQPGADCCDECDGNVDTAVQDQRPTKKDFDPDVVIHRIPAMSRHDSADPPGRKPPDLTPQFAGTTPVSLRDRMLD